VSELELFRRHQELRRHQGRQRVSFRVPSGSISSGLIGPNGPARRPSSTGHRRLPIRPGVDPLEASTSSQKARPDRGGGRRAHVPEHSSFQPDVGLDNCSSPARRSRRSGLHGALLRTASFLDEEKALRARPLELLDVFELGRLADEPSTSSLLRRPAAPRNRSAAMMLGPKLLLLDEPAAGMNYGEAEGLKKQIRWLRERFRSDGCPGRAQHAGRDERLRRDHVLDYGETIATDDRTRSPAPKGARCLPR